MFYSIYPLENIMETKEKDIELYQLKMNQSLSLLVEKKTAETYSVHQVISSDPADYLNKKIQPGNILKLNLQLN